MQFRSFSRNKYYNETRGRYDRRTNLTRSTPLPNRWPYLMPDPRVIPVPRLFRLIWLDAAYVMRRTLHQLANQAAGLIPNFTARSGRPGLERFRFSGILLPRIKFTYQRAERSNARSLYVSNTRQRNRVNALPFESLLMSLLSAMSIGNVLKQMPRKLIDWLTAIRYVNVLPLDSLQRCVIRYRDSHRESAWLFCRALENATFARRFRAQSPYVNERTSKRSFKVTRWLCGISVELFM